MGDCLKFPSIDQFRNAIRNIKNKASFDGLDEEGKAKYKQVIFPTLTFFGTVKAHGTNASIRQDSFGVELIFQSRERIITPLDDNAGFATYMHSLYDKLTYDIKNIRIILKVPNDEVLTIYGEWAGGNIQSGVAINGLEKMFLVFAVRIGKEENTKWIRPHDPRFDMFNNYIPQIYSITKFGTYSIEVDINNPEIAQNKLVKLVEEIEKECPIGKYFDKSGVGEGLVFYSIDEKYQDDSVFKAKGEKHSASKVKTVAAVDVEKVAKLKDLVDMLVTENRLEQMVSVLKDKEGLDIDDKNTGAFLKLVLQDIFKEEMDTIIENGFETKEFSNAAMPKIRQFWLSK